VIITLLFLGLLAYAALVARDAPLAGLTLIAAGYVLGPLFLPVRYALDPEGLTRTSPLATRRYAWSRFARYHLGPEERTVVLHFSGRRWGGLKGGVTLFIPDPELARQVTERLRAWMGAAGERG
jgi:hypothetical protein